VYHTADPVNRATLEELARPLGLPIEHREPRDGLASAAVILIDAEYWWTSRAQRHQGLLALLAQGNRSRGVAVHGYQFSDEEIDWLREQGIHACTRLDAGLVALLAEALAGLPRNGSDSARVP
jgi:hypothetical protein